jgi:hypothetical protein
LRGIIMPHIVRIQSWLRRYAIPCSGRRQQLLRRRSGQARGPRIRTIGRGGPFSIFQLPLGIKDPVSEDWQHHGLRLRSAGEEIPSRVAALSIKLRVWMSASAIKTASIGLGWRAFSGRFRNSYRPPREHGAYRILEARQLSYRVKFTLSIPENWHIRICVGPPF